MANNSRGLCPNCGGSGHECCGGKVSEEASKHFRSRIVKLEAANAKLVELCEEYEAQWGDDYLAHKWGLKEALAEVKKELSNG